MVDERRRLVQHLSQLTPNRSDHVSRQGTRRPRRKEQQGPFPPASPPPSTFPALEPLGAPVQFPPSQLLYRVRNARAVQPSSPCPEPRKACPVQRAQAAAHLDPRQKPNYTTQNSRGEPKRKCRLCKGRLGSPRSCSERARGAEGERITRGRAGCVRGARVESRAGGEEAAAPARSPPPPAVPHLRRAGEQAAVPECAALRPAAAGGRGARPAQGLSFCKV